MVIDDKKEKIGVVISEAISKARHIDKFFSEIRKQNIADIPIESLVKDLGGLPENLSYLIPTIQKEIKIALKENNGVITVESFFNRDDGNGHTVESIYEKMLRNIQTREIMPNLDILSIRPNRFVIPNSYLANSLHGRFDNKGNKQEIIGAGMLGFPVLPTTSKKRNVSVNNRGTAVFITVALDDDVSLELKEQPYTAFDSCVMDAVSSLYAAGNRVITSEQVCRTMQNADAGEGMHRTQIDAVSRSIYKLMNIRITADFTPELSARGIKDEYGNQVRFIANRSPLLSANSIQVTVGNGKIIDAFELVEPILLKYSRMTGQLILADIQLLDIRVVENGVITKKSVPTTMSRIPIKIYLLRRIEVMKHDKRRKNQNNCIRFESIFQEADVNVTSKTVINRTKKYIYQVLNYWIALEYITGYQVYKDGQGKSETGVKILWKIE